MTLLLETENTICSIDNIAPYTAGCSVTTKSADPGATPEFYQGNRIGGEIIRGGQFTVQQDDEVLFTSEPIESKYLN